MSELEQQIEFLKSALEGCPPPTTWPADLMGFITPVGAHVCCRCASRLNGRGISLGRARPVWKDNTPVFGCSICSASEVGQ